MPTVQVTVKDFWLPTGKKRYVLKAADDKLYGVPESLKTFIEKGKSYKLSYKIDNWQGREYMVVEGVVDSSQTALPLNGAAQAAQQPSSPSTLLDEKQVDISVLSLTSSSKWLEKITPGDVAGAAHVLRSLRLAWIQSKSKSLPSKIETGNEDMNDDIPY